MKCTDYDTLIDSIENCTRKALLKNRNHPSIFEIHKRKKNRWTFYFNEVSIEYTSKEILKLDNKKASQNSDIPTKILKENADIFTEYLYSIINGSIKLATFSSCLKVADIASIHTKDKKRYKRKL